MKRLFNFLFSRYFLSALLILVEIVGLVFVNLYLAGYSALFYILAAILHLAVLVAVINKDMNPEYRVTWLAVVLLFPVVGVVIYILFSGRSMSARDKRLAREILLEVDELADEPYALNSLASVDRLAAGKAMAILSGDPTAEVYENTASRYYSLGEDMYLDMLAAIESARKFVFLEFFIIEGGEMWQGIEDALIRKAGEGVEIRLMYDDVGCLGRVDNSFFARLISAGIEVRPFGRITPLVSAAHNNRDHRKILVVDGVVGFTGGVNVTDEYINKDTHLGHWKDGGIRLEGDAVRGLSTLFLTLWDINRGEKSDYARYLCATGRSGPAAVTLACTSVCDTPISTACSDSSSLALRGASADGGDSPSVAAKSGDGYYLTFGSGPKPLYQTEVGKRAFIDVINQARDYVYVTTPYLIVGYDLTEALIGAAERGVDVRIITPATADKRFVKTMTKSAYPHLIAGGVGIYEYTPGFMHQKLLVSDDRYAIVGTINFDYRSLVHHFEDAVWMYGTPAVIAARDDFLAALDLSHRMSEEESRLTPVEWLVKCALRLFAPLL